MKPEIAEQEEGREDTGVVIGADDHGVDYLGAFSINFLLSSLKPSVRVLLRPLKPGVRVKNVLTRTGLR